MCPALPMRSCSTISRESFCGLKIISKYKMTRVLMVSMRNEKISEEASEVRGRMAGYGSLFEELHIIVFSIKGPGVHQGKIKISENTYVYPTNSTSKLYYI